LHLIGASVSLLAAAEHDFLFFRNSMHDVAPSRAILIKNYTIFFTNLLHLLPAVSSNDVLGMRMRSQGNFGIQLVLGETVLYLEICPTSFALHDDERRPLDGVRSYISLLSLF